MGESSLGGGARCASCRWQRLKFQLGIFCSAYEIIFCDKLCLGRLSENILLLKGVMWQANFLGACIFIYFFKLWIYVQLLTFTALQIDMQEVHRTR